MIPLTENPDRVVMGGPDGNKPGSTLSVDPNAHGPGIRDILESIKTLDAHAAPESFFVTKDTTLVAGEIDRARRWGAQLTDKSRAFEVNTIRDGKTRSQP